MLTYRGEAPPGQPGLAGLLGTGKAYMGVSLPLGTCWADISSTWHVKQGSWGPGVLMVCAAEGRPSSKFALRKEDIPSYAPRLHASFARARLRPISRLLFI